MSKSNRYPPELRQQAVRLVFENELAAPKSTRAGGLVKLSPKRAAHPRHTEESQGVPWLHGYGDCQTSTSCDGRDPGLDSIGR